MEKKQRKPMSLYKKSLLIYSSVLAVLVLVLLIYVLCALKDYEKYEVGNFIKDSVADLSYKDLVDVVDDKKLEVNKYEKLSSKKDIIKAIDKALEDKKNIKYELNKDSKDKKKPIYDIFYKGKKVLTIKLKNKGDVTKIKILNYSKWELVDIKSHIEEGLYSVNAYIPEDYKLYINGKEVKEFTEGENDVTKIFAQFTDLKKFNTYAITGLVEKPKVEVKDGAGKTVKTVVKDGKITLENVYYKTDSVDEAKAKLVTDIDILGIAEKYSLFLTDDLNGYSHGFGTLQGYLIEGTDLYKMAYDWAHGIDITFTSRHTLKNPTFTDEKLSNFVIYSDKAFSVDVNLKKNMTVKGEDRVMEMNDRLSFVYYNDSWKLISMESI